MAPADASGLSANSVDLVIVAQALHWFERERFYAEVRRVAVASGILAAWTYGLPRAGDRAIDSALAHFHAGVVGPFWPPERRLVDTGYSTIDFPFTEFPAPVFEMRADWTLAQLLGYLRTWSATDRFVNANGYDPVGSLGVALGAIWGDGEIRRRIVWPLAVRAGRV